MATGITQIVPRYMHYGETFSLPEGMLAELEASYTAAADYGVFQGQTSAGYEMGWFGFKHSISKPCYVIIFSRTLGIFCGYRTAWENGSWYFYKIMQY